MKVICLAIVYFLLAVELKYVFTALQGAAFNNIEERKSSPGPVKWDSSSLRRISPEGLPSFYPRMLQLRDGSLLLVYAAKGNIVFQTSTDGGSQWSMTALAAEKVEGINMDTPELLQLSNGNLLLFYNGRPQAALRGKPDSAKLFDIRVKKSTDNGITWQPEQRLYQGGASFKNGCWEPAALQLPNGEIQLFFSDESIYTSSDEQNISLLRSKDNGSSWTVKPEIISFRTNSRDGMPVPLWLPGEKVIALAIEDPGKGNFKPFVIRSSIMGQWKGRVGGSDGRRQSALVLPLADSIYAGAPYLRRLSTGITVLSYQSTEGRRGKNTDANAVMVVVTGNEQASGFGNASIPFTVPEGSHALWNSLCITRGDTIIALTATNAYSKSISGIWMIKGTLQTP